MQMLRLQLPESRMRAHYVKARVKVREYPDGNARRLPRTALPGPLRSSRAARSPPRPRQPGLVLDAVKAWPGSVGAGRTRARRPALTCVSTRGRWRAMGRDEETGFQVEQRN